MLLMLIIIRKELGRSARDCTSIDVYKLKICYWFIFLAVSWYFCKCPESIEIEE